VRVGDDQYQTRDGEQRLAGLLRFDQSAEKLRREDRGDSGLQRQGPHLEVRQFEGGRVEETGELEEPGQCTVEARTTTTQRYGQTHMLQFGVLQDSEGTARQEAQ